MARTTSEAMDERTTDEREPGARAARSIERVASVDATAGCDRWQDALSALADGEDPGVDARLVDAHVRRCTDCAGFAAVLGRPAPSAVDSDVSVPVRSAPSGATGRIARAVAFADRSSHPLTVRVLLGVVAAEVIVLSLPDLIRGGEAASAHEARHLGAFAVAYGVALLVVALRPARARTMLPAAAVVALALTITAAVDLAHGRIPLLGEALHIPEIVSVVLVWLLARHPPLAAGTNSRHG